MSEHKQSGLAIYLDPPSHHFLQDRLFIVEDGRLTGDRLNAPYAYLREFFNARGIPVRTADYLPPSDYDIQKIYVSFGMRHNYQNMLHRKDVIPCAFFAMECPIVEPAMYRAFPDLHKVFRRIFSWSDSQSLERFVGQSVPCEHFCWPQSFDDVHEDIWRRTDRKFLVMINANKLPRIYWQELYTERLRAVEFFSRTGEIDLFGKGWDAPPFPMTRIWTPYTFRRLYYTLKRAWSRLRPDPLLQAAQCVYRGTTPAKSQTLGQYTFALCFENMILKGWITEKIFDCFFAGTIPIYWGAPDIEEYVPAECFIDMRKFSGYPELRLFLKSLNDTEVQTYREAAREYLRSQRFWSFSKRAFAELFVRMIEEDTGIRV